MMAPRSTWISHAEFIFVGLTALWLLIWRILLDTPWGFAPVPTTGGLVNVGIVCNPVDTWSYLSWVQQYYHGTNLAGLLYTTEPHAPLLWLFPLWLIGKFAAWTGLPVIGTYNAAGILGAMAAVFCFLRAATALRLPPSARHWAAVAFVFGSGGSWLWHLAHKLGWASPADGGDLFFLDLFPSTTLIAYAYHALGLALLLGFSRPYEPAAFLGAWILKTGWHGLHRRREPAVWRNSATIAALLAVALSPGIGWTLWVSTRPVWSAFAHESLTLGLGSGAWLWGLGGWIIFVALGIGPARRTDARLAALPLAASVLLAIILLGFGSAHTKLASGLIFGPLLLSGWGAARVVAATGRLPDIIRIGATGLVLGALLGIASLFMNFNALKLRGPALVDAGLITLARRLPFAHGQPPPLVLTDRETGGILPGLVGARIWAGHWALSGHYAAKVARLQSAGLDPEKHAANQAEAGHALDRILAEFAFDYALIDRRCPQAIAGLAAHGWRSLETTARWNLLQAPPASP